MNHTFSASQFRSVIGAACSVMGLTALGATVCHTPLPTYSITTTTRAYLAYSQQPTVTPQICVNAVAVAGDACFNTCSPSGMVNARSFGEGYASCVESVGAIGYGGGCYFHAAGAQAAAWRLIGVGNPLELSAVVRTETTTYMGNEADSRQRTVILGSWATATGGISLSNPGVSMNYASTGSVVVDRIDQPGLLADRTASPSQVLRLARTFQMNGVTTTQTVGHLNEQGATFGSGVVTSNSVTYTLPTVTQPIAAGDVVLNTSVSTVYDAYYDVNGDGAFDAGDPAWIRGHFRSIDVTIENPYTIKGNYVVTWPELDPPEAVDESDAVYLENILAKVGPSSRAGDYNNDGVLDCQDSYGALAYFDSQIGDQDYVYALDMNRDGIVDQSDKVAFFGLVNQCDFNQDAAVDDADFTIFSNAYGILDCADPSMPAYCPADLNVDGIVDDADFAIFIIRYNAVVC